MGEIPSLHNIELTLINGEKVTLSKYAGRKLLIVNVASKCGFTSQYQGLQELYKANTEKLEIIAVPCNDFGGQEPGNQQEIVDFCEKMYGVTFTIADKVKIVSSPHPLYQWLMSKELNGVRDVDITWNFYKFLINEEGQLEHVYSSDVHPFDDEIYSWVVSAESRLSAS
jgi:glutathione peroxidase